MTAEELKQLKAAGPEHEVVGERYDPTLMAVTFDQNKQEKTVVAA